MTYIANPAPATIRWEPKASSPGRAINPYGGAFLRYMHTDGLAVERELVHAEWLNRLNRPGRHIFGLTIGTKEIRCNARRLRGLSRKDLSVDLAHEWWHGHDIALHGVGHFETDYFAQAFFLLRGSGRRNTWEDAAYGFDEGWAMKFEPAAQELIDRGFFA